MGDIADYYRDIGAEWIEEQEFKKAEEQKEAIKWYKKSLTRQELSWRQKDGSVIKVVEMTDEHVQNSLDMLIRNNECSEWQTVLYLELKARKK